jgi:hypothetical protein
MFIIILLACLKWQYLYSSNNNIIMLANKNLTFIVPKIKKKILKIILFKWFPFINKKHPGLHNLQYLTFMDYI